MFTKAFPKLPLNVRDELAIVVTVEFNKLEKSADGASSKSDIFISPVPLAVFPLNCDDKPDIEPEMKTKLGEFPKVADETVILPDTTVNCALPKFPVNEKSPVVMLTFKFVTVKFERSASALFCKSLIVMVPSPDAVFPDKRVTGAIISALLCTTKLDVPITAEASIVIELGLTTLTKAFPKFPVNVTSPPTNAVTNVVKRPDKSAAETNSKDVMVVAPKPDVETPESKEAGPFKEEFKSTTKVATPMFVVIDNVISLFPVTFTIDFPREPLKVPGDPPVNSAFTIVVAIPDKSAKRFSANSVTFVVPAPETNFVVSKEAEPVRMEPLSTTKLDVPIVAPERVIVLELDTFTTASPNDPVKVTSETMFATTLAQVIFERSAAGVLFKFETIIFPYPLIVLPEAIEASIVNVAPLPTINSIPVPKFPIKVPS